LERPDLGRNAAQSQSAALTPPLSRTKAMEHNTHVRFTQRSLLKFLLLLAVGNTVVLYGLALLIVLGILSTSGLAAFGFFLFWSDYVCFHAWLRRDVSW